MKFLILKIYRMKIFIKKRQKTPLLYAENGARFYHTPKLTAYIFAAFLNELHLALPLDFNTSLESAFSTVI